MPCLANAVPSAIHKNMLKRRAVEHNPLTLILYRPTYIMPFYYTGSPYGMIYHGNTPNDQIVKNSEFKGQISFLAPIVTHAFNNPNVAIVIAYTQLNYWQVYAKSQYFRETNYEPEIFYENHFHPDWILRMGVNHQSNGRGGNLERSWNRAIATLQYSQTNWMASINLWSLIFSAESSSLHNPDIVHYLGHDNILLAFHVHRMTVSLLLQNLESGFIRGHQEITLSYPLSKRFSLYTQFFNGYGQSLIEYNHKTKSIGVGFAFNDWLLP